MNWLVVGLGNPGSAYAATRHNIGYLVADQVAERVGGKFSRHKPTRSQVVEGQLVDQRIVLGRSRSYMNDSGAAVAALLRYFKLEPNRLIVIHDELDIGWESLRLKFGGGDNGHNGLKSIRSAIGTGDFYRVRVGIGRPDDNLTVHDFVLKPFSGPERSGLPQVVDRAADAIESLMLEGLSKTQSHFNS